MSASIFGPSTGTELPAPEELEGCIPAATDAQLHALIGHLERQEIPEFTSVLERARQELARRS